ncbi:hypothetical protein Y032_0105g3700 [Ancylostoma ceylanicum]|uniref:Uncharacterized protein n=1 Tax=Ancylostoma ceylanicum TaxID=53326 RepID=A0A016TGI3_9BILA|nr:hypothetical protein Y032_0105g3700 [Ancylostoma ceylanicum]
MSLFPTPLKHESLSIKFIVWLIGKPHLTKTHRRSQFRFLQSCSTSSARNQSFSRPPILKPLLPMLFVTHVT